MLAQDVVEKIGINSNEKCGKPGGYGTPEQILKKRLSGHHRTITNAKVDKVSSSYRVIRGREQQLFDYYQRLGRLTNQIRPISPRNKKNGKDYMAAVRRVFGDL